MTDREQWRLWKLVLLAGLFGAALSFVGQLVKPKRIDAWPNEVNQPR